MQSKQGPPLADDSPCLRMFRMMYLRCVMRRWLVALGSHWITSMRSSEELPEKKSSILGRASSMYR